MFDTEIALAYPKIQGSHDSKIIRRDKNMDAKQKTIKKLIRDFGPAIEKWFVLRFDYEAENRHWDTDNIYQVFEKKNPIGELKSFELLKTIQQGANKKPDDNMKLEYWKKMLKKWESEYEKFETAIQKLHDELKEPNIWKNIVRLDSVNTDKSDVLLECLDTDKELERTRVQNIYKGYHEQAYPILNGILGHQAIHGRNTSKAIIATCIKRIREMEMQTNGNAEQSPISLVVKKYEGLGHWTLSVNDLVHLSNELSRLHYINDLTRFRDTMTGRSELGEKCLWYEDAKGLPILFWLFFYLKKHNILKIRDQKKWVLDNFYDAERHKEIGDSFKKFTSKPGQYEDQKTAITALFQDVFGLKISLT